MGLSPKVTGLLTGTAALFLSACGDGLDLDFRDLGNGFDTTEAARRATADRPLPDSRGIISYPNYQVAIAKRGDTVSGVAERLGLDPANVASFNGLPADTALRDGEVIILPARVSEPSPATGSALTGPIRPAGEVDVAALAGPAIERSGPGGQAAAVIPQTGLEPVRHEVERGETAFTIARLYNVSVRSLAEWNGLGADFDVREGQTLLIPVAIETAALPAAPAVLPGTGSVAPEPPSAATPLPETAAAPTTRPTAPASPELSSDRTAASDTAQFLMPVSGSIIRPFDKGTNDGIGIGAPAGSEVRAAGDGTVAAITRDTDQVPILVIRHGGNLLTVYAGVDAIAVEKGDKVKRGERIAQVRDANPAFVHFEVREGFESVDPLPYLN